MVFTLSIAPKTSDITSPIRKASNAFHGNELASPVTPTSHTSSSSISLNGPPSEAPPPLPLDHQASLENDADPFASAPFSLPSALRRRASNKIIQ